MDIRIKSKRREEAHALPKTADESMISFPEGLTRELLWSATDPRIVLARRTLRFSQWRSEATSRPWQTLNRRPF